MEIHTPLEIEPAELMAGLSRALDLTEGEPMGHSIRACWIGMHLAQDLSLPPLVSSDLYYALLLKDAGCSANAAQVSSWFGTDDQDAKSDLKQVNWSRFYEAVRFALRNAAPQERFSRRLGQMVQLSQRGLKAAHELVAVRCTRGAQIVRSLGWSEGVPDAVLSLDEHWDGSGYPQGLRAQDIPLLSRMLLLCQTVEIFWRRQGPEGAIRVVSERRGRWFDPELAEAFLRRAQDPAFFAQLGQVDTPEAIRQFFPSVTDAFRKVGDMLHTAEVFGQIVDAKSPWTRLHSIRTARYAQRIARDMGLPPQEQQEVLLAGFFHDLGKLGVSNLILDKPGQLTLEERQRMERHALLTYEILEPLTSLRSVAFRASCHHERLDGSGYAGGLAGAEVPLASQIVAVADVFDALTADRPYREGLSVEEAFQLMRPDAGIKLNGSAFEALMARPEVISEDDVAWGAWAQ